MGRIVYLDWQGNEIEPPKADPIPITNADRLRSMSDEAMADFITDDMCELLCGAPLSCDGQCKQKMIDWLKQEARG